MTENEINERIAKLLNNADSDIDKLLKTYESSLIKTYKEGLDDIKKDIAYIFEKYGGKVEYPDMIKYNRLTNLEIQITEIIKSLTNESIKTTTTALKDIYTTNYYRTGYALETGLGMELGFGKLNHDLVRAAVLNKLDRIKWPERLKDHAQVYVKQVKSDITQGLLRGKGYGNIAKSVTKKTKMQTWKALRIVRTEGHRVQNASRLIGYDTSEKAAERLGIVTERIWVHTKVGEYREDHALMNGKAADKDGMFTLPSGVKTEGPGLSGIADEDINCKCTTRIGFVNSSPKNSYWINYFH